MKIYFMSAPGQVHLRRAHRAVLSQEEETRQTTNNIKQVITIRQRKYNNNNNNIVLKQENKHQGQALEELTESSLHIALE